MGRSYKLCKSCDNMKVFREHRYHVSICITAFPEIACGTYFLIDVDFHYSQKK